MPAEAPEAAERERARRAVARYFETRDVNVRNDVVRVYQGLAYSLAARFHRRGEELEDLNQVALIGLMKAIDRYDPRRGVELTTYATATILGELKRHLRDRAWSVRLPRRVHDLHLRAQRAIDELTQELGRSPTLTEVSGRAAAAVEEVVEALEAVGMRFNASLEVRRPSDEEDPLVSSGVSGDHPLADVDRRLELLPLLERLPEREQEILRLRFVAGCTQTEIAKAVGVSQMQVSRLLSRSLALLRAWAEDEGAALLAEGPDRAPPASPVAAGRARGRRRRARRPA
jgi:RNA polymerase sigma-B factor